MEGLSSPCLIGELHKHKIAHGRAADDDDSDAVRHQVRGRIPALGQQVDTWQQVSHEM